MARETIALPNLVMTTSMTNTSTAAIAFVDISDAVVLSGFVDATTTAPGFQLEVAYSSSTGATFVPVRVPYPISTANAVGGAAVLVPHYLTSAGFIIPVVAAKLARFGSSAAHTSTTATLNWVKQVEV